MAHKLSTTTRQRYHTDAKTGTRTWPHSECGGDDSGARDRSDDEWSATDPDYKWPMDEPHPED